MTEPGFLQDARLAPLRELGMDIAVPGFLPPDFALEAVESERDPQWGASYRLAFRGPRGEALFVDGLLGGLGDVMRGESRQAFACALGEGQVEFYGPDAEEPVDFRSHWLQAHPEAPAYGVAGRGLDAEEAVRVAEGLALLA